MASITLYDTAIVPIIQTLKHLSTILKRGEAYADEKGIDHSELLEGRIVADMHALPFQVLTACNTAKFLAVRVAGVQDVTFVDDEKTFAELQTRLTRTIEFLEAIDRKQFDGKETAEVVAFNRTFTGLSYINSFALPNFFFHAVTTYNILRSKGVDIGKSDWLGVR